MMKPNKKAAPSATNQRETSAKIRAHRNLKTTIKHIYKHVFLQPIRREIKAGIGLLFYKDMISFGTACKIAKGLQVQND